MTSGASAAEARSLTAELDRAHWQGVGAARNGMQDAALGAGRVTGAGVTALADAAVSSATPFLRAPLLSRISAVRRLHPGDGDGAGLCPTCRVAAPCETAQEVGP